MSEKKACAILLNMGGPSSTAEIPGYLFNIFSDRAIIRLPGGRLFQKPFARMISKLRSKKVQAHYDLIGGGSPLLKWTGRQAKHVADGLSDHFDEFSVYLGMRYSEPSIPKAVSEALADGYRKIILCPLYPQYSKATTGSSFLVADEALEGVSDATVLKISDFHRHPDYIELMRVYIRDNCPPENTLLFSAHSIPQKFVDEGDPYVDQVRETARLAADGREYFVSFQSRSGPVTWVGPDTIEETRRLLTERLGDLFLVPISFVSDHIETLYEIDIELKDLLGAELGARLKRMPMFNDDARFGAMLANLIKETFESYAAV